MCQNKFLPIIMTGSSTAIFFFDLLLSIPVSSYGHVKEGQFT